MTCLPFGVRFCPTEEDLITYYLRNKAMKQPLPWDEFIIERCIYGETATPWMLFNDNDPWQTLVDPLGKVLANQKVIYVYTKLSNVGKTGDKNKNRVAGCGKWHMNATEKIRKNGVGEQIGSKRTFTFQSVEETVGQWIMHEFALTGASLEGLNSDDNFVLCRIKRDDAKSSKGGRLVSRKNSRNAATESDDHGLEATKRRPDSNEDHEFESNKKLRISNDLEQEFMSNGTTNSCATIISTAVSCPPESSSNINKEADIASGSGSVDAAVGVGYSLNSSNAVLLSSLGDPDPQIYDICDDICDLDELNALLEDVNTCPELFVETTTRRPDSNEDHEFERNKKLRISNDLEQELMSNSTTNICATIISTVVSCPPESSSNINKDANIASSSGSVDAAFGVGYSSNSSNAVLLSSLEDLDSQIYDICDLDELDALLEDVNNCPELFVEATTRRPDSNDDHEFESNKKLRISNDLEQEFMSNSTTNSCATIVSTVVSCPPESSSNINKGANKATSSGSVDAAVGLGYSSNSSNAVLLSSLEDPDPQIYDVCDLDELNALLEDVNNCPELFVEATTRRPDSSEDHEFESKKKLRISNDLEQEFMSNSTTNRCATIVSTVVSCPPESSSNINEANKASGSGSVDVAVGVGYSSNSSNAVLLSSHKDPYPQIYDICDLDELNALLEDVNCPELYP